MNNLEKLLRIEKIVTEKDLIGTEKDLKEYVKVLIEIEKEYTD